MKTRTSSYKVFLSYNSEDHEMVESIAVYLDDRAKLRPWFDRWEVVPGESAIRQMERGLAACEACVVFVGPSGQGPWQEEEVEAVLHRAAKKEGFRVIPALLPGLEEKPDLPPLLANKAWISLARGLEDDRALYLLECGIRGVPPGRQRPRVEQDPDPGLRECEIAGKAPVQVARAKHSANVFISYRRQETDAALAKLFADVLERAGHEVFIDTAIRWGMDWVLTIRDALEKADFLLLLLSREAAASEMVMEEIDMARELAQTRNGLPIILPLRLCLPFSEDLPSPVSHLLRDIQQETWNRDADTSRIVDALLEILNNRDPAWRTVQPRLSERRPPASTCRTRNSIPGG